ncbi:hypothetical protein T3H00_28385 [Pseudomonas fluorescens]|uniref:hypothetical protein n=1 Tax=Pseudomonas fluorescens TaxID=294 RepID=UPI002ACA811E|nr:hypothetical protein [Pseudomonas fluorescens]MDZ5436566.1 hypothetical protein [Pseudomonas fluorescens]
MAKVLAQITVKLPRLMEAGGYRKLRYAGGKPSLQQLKKWIEEGEVIGEVKGGMYFVDVQARQDLGDRLIGQLDVLAMAEYLDQFSNNAYTKHRGLWVQIFAFAVAKGLAERNNAELTLVKKEAEKKRQRHTLEGLKSIIDAATTPPWLKRAIRLALASLQRREDIVTWLKSAVDMDKNTLTVSPGKTQGYDHVPARERPTFHEIRALGSWLYEQQNFPTEYILALMGHADEKMTRHYQEGHDEKKIEYLEVGAELAL